MSNQSAPFDEQGGKVRIRYVKGLRRSETVYPVVCPNCGQERWLKKWDAYKAMNTKCPCYRCSQSAKGRLGGLAVSSKHGVNAIVKPLRDYRLAHPSNLEREVMTLLDELGLPYEREVWCTCDGQVYLIDFVIAEHFAVEVNGTYFHRQSQVVDANKVVALEACGYRVLVLTQTQIEAGEAHALLQQHLANH